MGVGEDLVGIPSYFHMIDRKFFKPAGDKVEHGLSFGENVHLVHILLNKQEIKAHYLVFVIRLLEIDICVGAAHVDLFDVIACRRAGDIVVVRNADLYPFEGADVVFKHFPLNVIIHIERSVFIYVDRDHIIKDLVGGGLCACGL